MPSKNIVMLIFLFLHLFCLGSSGRILNGDIWVDYANAGSMTQISFSFMLENPIDQFDYIKASLPFPLHSSLIPAYPATEGLSLPYGLEVTYQTVDQSSNILPTVLTCQALTETIDSSNYYIRFYSADRKTLVAIPNNQWLYLKFKIYDGTPLQYQKSNSILQVQMATVSSVWSNAMIYDDNLAFGYFELASAPSQGITLQTDPYDYGPVGGYLLTQASYKIHIDVSMNVPTYQFNENLKLIFFIGQQNIDINQNYKFAGTCSSVEKTNSPKINALDTSLYLCSIDVINNLMVVVLKPQALALQTSYRFTVGIINPPIVMKDVNITVKAIKEISKVILSYGRDIAALTTNQIYVTYQEIFLGWGLRPDALLPFDARIFRGNAATPTYMPYNSLSTKFSISQSTSSNIQLKIQINIPSQLSAYVLENGYTHNFPAFPGKQVKCVVQYSSDTIKRKITCTGVGALQILTIYEIGWKMFFPYDNYQSSIDCTKFGLLTIYTAQTITEKDNAFILGRGNEFLSFLKSSDDYYVIGRNSSYITYMKTFANLNLIVLSSDFQDFLKIPEEIIVINRPATYSDKVFNDVYVVGQNLAFMTYLQLFNDIYVAFRLKSNSDITKGFDDTPLVATSMPKNTLTIKTSNSKDWTDYSTNDLPLVSSSATLGGNSPTYSLKKMSATSQSLIFSMKAIYSQVSSTNSANSVVTDNWGMLIMMSPKIKLNSPTVSLFQSSSLTASAETVNTAQAYNKYTLITLKASTPAQIQVIFPTTATKTAFGLESFWIQDFSSIYSDENNYDIMIATIDGIDGPLNRITYNGFFLINGFTITDAGSLLTSIQTSFVAYSVSSPMDGSKVPTMLRVKGQIPGSTNFNTLNIFFDKLTPFFQNYHNGDIFCKSTDGTPFCKFYKGSELSIATQIHNYMTFSRIQIPLSSPGTAFDILIPIVHTTGKSSIFAHIGYTTKDPSTGKVSNSYIEPRKTFSQTGSSLASGVYGPDVTGKTLGATINNMALKASRSGITVNSASSWGAAFLYFSQWDYFKGSTTTWANGPCYMMNYLLYQTNYILFLSGTPFTFTYKNMKGVVCFCDSAASTSSMQLTFSTGYLPTKWGIKLPGWGAYSQNTGQLYDIKINSMDVSTPLALTGTMTTPTMGPLLAKSVGQWVIPLPVALTDNVEILMTGASGNLPFTATSGTCCINIGDKKTPIGCTYTSSLTQVDYILTIKERDLLPTGTSMQIMHYGLTTNASYSTTNFNLKVYTLVNTNSPGTNDIIFQQTGLQFKYGGADTSYIGKSDLILSSYLQETNNKASITSFNFSFTLLSKGLYITNRVRINLGQYQVDNSASSVSPKCKIYKYSTDGSPNFSHDWAAIDISRGFDELQFWPEKNLLSTNLTYTVKCYNFLATSTSSPVGLSGKVVNTSSDLTGELSTTSNVALATLTPLTKSNQISASKKFIIPSTSMEISFTVTSPGITPNSILYIGFPSYYANGLGADIKCYTSAEIQCIVNKGRELMIRYLGTYTSGTKFIVQVVGVAQPVNYNSGTFYFVIDDDDNRNTVLSSGTFVDSVSTSVLDTQNFPAFQILSFTQSSAHLREQGIEITMQFYIPSTLGSVTVGQYLFLVFPPNFKDVLRFVQPSCILNIRGNSLKNYISSCTVKGLRLKMLFLDDLVLGSVYYLKIDNIINPTNPSSNVYKYALEISSTSGTSIAARSFSPHANFEMPIFVINPIRQSLNYYTQDGIITQVTTTANIQSQQIFISTSNALTTSAYSRNVYLAAFNNLYSSPSKIDLLSGQNPYPIRMSGLTSGINYVYFQKTGDGSYYSNLPPLMLMVNKNYFTPVSFLQTSFKLPVSTVNTNYTVGVNLPIRLYPITEVSLQVTLSSTSVGISLRQSPTIIKFYPQKTSASINLYINDATLWISGTTTNLVITPSDTNTYAGPVTIPVTATGAVLSTPTLTLTSQPTSLKKAIFSVSCSEHGRFVYHISRLFSYNSTACPLKQTEIQYWVKQSSIDGLRVDETFYQCEDILGMVNIATPGTTQSLTISNLKTTTNYAINGYCLSQIGTKSPLKTLSFSTQPNNGYVSKMDFKFQTPLTASQKIKLVCALALKFQINYQKVSTADGYYCSQLLSSRRMLQGQRRVLTQSYPYRVEVYFGINRQLNSDTSPAVINGESVTQAGIQSELNNVIGLPTLVSMSVSSASYVGSNEIKSGYYIDVGSSYVYIEGMTMSSEGIIYVIIGQKDLWTRAPVISEIKKGSGPNGLPPVFYKVLAYRTQEPQSSYVAYTGMPDKNLSMYILASNDNPFDDASFGEVLSFEIVPEIATWEKSLIIFSAISMILLLM